MCERPATPRYRAHRLGGQAVHLPVIADQHADAVL
jgi:hypothetical protein